MTNEARAKLAQIAAFELGMGTAPAAIESKLLSMVSDLSQFELNAAMLMGRTALQMGQAVNAKQAGPVESYLDNLFESGYSLARVQAVFRIGPGPDDWRTVAPLVSVGQSMADIVEQTKGELRDLLSRNYGVKIDDVLESLTFRSIAPIH